MARSQMRRERPGHTLQCTALVHEAYLRLAALDAARWQNRAVLRDFGARDAAYSGRPRASAEGSQTRRRCGSRAARRGVDGAGAGECRSGGARSLAGEAGRDRSPWSPSPTTATSSTTWRAGSWSSTAAAGIPFEGNYSSWLEQKQARLAQEEKQDSSWRARWPTSSTGFAWPRRPARPRGRPASRRTRSSWRRPSEPRAADDKLEIFIPSGPRLGDLVDRGRPCPQGLGDRLLIEHLSFTLPPGRHRRRHRPERRGQDDAVSHDHRRARSPTTAPCGSARR